jgi:hypothetical protein
MLNNIRKESAMKILRPLRSPKQMLLDSWLLDFYSIAVGFAILGLVGLGLQFKWLDGPEWHREWVWCLGLGMAGFFYTFLVAAVLFARKLREPTSSTAPFNMVCVIMFFGFMIGLLLEAGVVHGVTVALLSWVILPAVAGLVLLVQRITRA